MKVTVQAPAKINLTLDVTGRREDGYHLLESVFQSVSCRDTVTAELAPAGTLALNCPGVADCPPEMNTVLRAARLFLQVAGVTQGVRLTVEKRIPQQAGMGGGSADAAGTLLALDALFGTGFSTERLCSLGQQIGADVPFCLMGGTAFVSGIGERLEPLPSLPDCSFVIAQPAEGMSTKEAYARLDTAALDRRPDHAAVRQALHNGDLTGVARQAINVFEPALALPGVAAIRGRMDAFAPLCSQMTGSGSAVFALFRNPAQAERCAAKLRQMVSVAFVCAPCGGCAVVRE